MVGGTIPPQSDSGDFQSLGPQPSLAKQAVLTHRPGYFCLDSAFALIEGHQANRGIAGGRSLAGGGGGGDERTFPLQENDSGLTPADSPFVKPL